VLHCVPAAEQVVSDIVLQLFPMQQPPGHEL
jgi:hypothetical protein